MLKHLLIEGRRTTGNYFGGFEITWRPLEIGTDMTINNESLLLDTCNFVWK
jgi:hypothetical protein